METQETSRWVKTHSSGQMTHKWEANTVAEVLPKGVRNPNLYQALQTGGPTLGQ